MPVLLWAGIMSPPAGESTRSISHRTSFPSVEVSHRKRRPKFLKILSQRKALLTGSRESGNSLKKLGSFLGMKQKEECSRQWIRLGTKSFFTTGNRFFERTSALLVWLNKRGFSWPWTNFTTMPTGSLLKPDLFGLVHVSLWPSILQDRKRAMIERRRHT